jgi:hypothetical protein
VFPTEWNLTSLVLQAFRDSVEGPIEEPAAVLRSAFQVQVLEGLLAQQLALR